MNSVAVYELDISSIEELPPSHFAGLMEMDLLEKVTSSEGQLPVTAGLYSTWETKKHFDEHRECFLQSLRTIDPNARLVWAGRLDRRIERNGRARRDLDGEVLHATRALDRRLMAVEIRQLEAEKKSRKWSRSDTISVCSIAVSAGVAIWALALTSNRAQDQTRNDLRSELRGMIQRIQAIPKEMNEIATKYPDPNQGQPLIDDLRLERAEVARQAAKIADRIPTDVSMIEYEAISRALFDYRSFADEERVLNDWAQATASSGSSAFPLIHARAQLEFLRGHDENGRSFYRQSLELSAPTPDEQHWQSYLTQIRWAQSEASRGNRKQVIPHFKDAQAHGEALPAQLQIEAMHGLLVQELSFAQARFRDDDRETGTQAFNAALIEPDPKVGSAPRLVNELNEEVHIAWAELAIMDNRLKNDAIFHFACARRLSQELNGPFEDRRFKARLETLRESLGLPRQSPN